jgi:hypothetical protein
MKRAVAGFRQWWAGITWRPDPADQVGRTNLVVSLRKTLMVLAAVVLVSVLGQIYTYESAQTHYKTDDRTALTASQQAQASCERSLMTAPELYWFYKTHHVLGPRALAYYKSTIPRHCE